MTDDTIHILHVDDDLQFAELTREFLREFDNRFTVHIETSPTAGFDYLVGNDVDCVISDYDMPGETGIEFLEQVRDQFPALPFILYTGRGSEEVASEAISAGVTDYLQKDSRTDHFELLSNRVSNAVDQARSLQEAERTRTRLRAIVENIDDAVLIIDGSSTIRFANPNVEATFGYSPAELVGESLTMLMPSRLETPHLDAFDRYMETGERTIDWQSIELVALHSDGHEVPIFVSFSQFAQGGEPRFIGIIREISSA